MLEVSNAFVQEQMHNLGFKYMKIKHISNQGNAAKSLVL